MAILLLVLLALAGLVVGDAFVENTSTTTVTLGGQELGGVTLGGWLAAFAVLGFITAYFLLGILAAARRSGARRRARRSSEREMAERVAELEKENVALRETSPDGEQLPHHTPVGQDRTLVDQTAARQGGDRATGHFAETGPGHSTTREPSAAPAPRDRSALDEQPSDAAGRRSG